MQATRVGDSAATYSSRHKSDTVDLLQRGPPLAYQVHRRFAKEAQAARSSDFLDARDRLALDDHLPNLVVELEQLGHGDPSLVAGAPAAAAALAGDEAKAFACARVDTRSQQRVALGLHRRGARRTNQADQAL